MSKEAMKLALEALKQIDEAMPFPVAKLAQAALREALAEQPAQHHSKAWPPSHWTDYERSIAAAEREKCAQLATTIAEQDLPEEMPEGEELLQAVRQIAIGVLIAKAIRARNNT